MNMAKRRVGKIVGCILLVAVILGGSGYYFLRQKNEAEASALSSKARNVGYPKMLFPPIDQSVVGWWKLNDAAGQTVVKDWTSNGNTGTSANNIVSATGYTGVANTAMSFNGSSDIISFSTSTTVTNTFAISFWAYPTVTHEIDAEANSGYLGGISGQKYIIQPGWAWPNGAVGVSMGTNGITVYEHGSSYMPPLAVYSGTIGQRWAHVTVVYNNRQPSIYLDGVLVRTGLTSGVTNTIGYIAGIGGEPSYGYFTGSISDVRIFNHALSANEVKGLYMRGRP